MAAKATKKKSLKNKPSPAYLDLTPGKLQSRRHNQRGRAPRNQAHIMHTMGDAYEAADGWVVVMATIPLYFYITVEMIARAVRGSGRYCVVGQALAAVFGEHIAWQVGPGQTKIWDIDAKIEVRFRTPGPLQKAIRAFDPKTGHWPLPANMYRLMPICDYTIRRKIEDAKNAEIRKKKKRACPRGKNKADTLVAVVSPGTVRRKPVRHKSQPSRTVLRNAQIKRGAFLKRKKSA